MTDIVRTLTPGYIFVCYYGVNIGEEPWMPSALRQDKMSGICHCLRYPDGTYELRDDDRNFALMLLENSGVIGQTDVHKEAERIRLRK